MLAPAGLGGREHRLGLVKLGWVGFYELLKFVMTVDNTWHPGLAVVAL